VAMTLMTRCPAWRLSKVFTLSATANRRR